MDWMKLIKQGLESLKTIADNSTIQSQYLEEIKDYLWNGQHHLDNIHRDIQDIIDGRTRIR